MSNPTLEDDVIAFLSDMADSISIFIRKISGKEPEKRTLAEFDPGSIVRIGNHEMIVLEQMDGKTALIRKECFEDESVFGSENTNYAESIVDSLCGAFADVIASEVGSDNILEHDVELTALTGDKSYGAVIRQASLLTLGRYQRYLDILDQHKPDSYWWMATANSTNRHENDRWALCVSPSGYFNNVIFISHRGVRPFCILKSDIFVSF